MAKVVDITEKLTFDGNPRLGIMGKELRSARMLPPC